ncbi:MAG: ScyD/ScyE family protein [Marmoricola sp.]
MQFSISARRRSATVAALTLGLGALAGAGLSPAAVADDGPGTVVAQGLDNPRLISFGPDGTLYVAESGTGGTSSCAEGPEGGSVCYGTTGAVTQVRNGQQSRLFSGLPSIADEGTGGSAIGPSEFFMQPGHQWSLSIGAGIDKAQRAALPASASVMGRILSGKIGHKRSSAADIVAFEWAHNPDHSTDEEGNPTRDSDPQGFVARGGSYVLADAGGNTLLRANRGGQVHTLAVFGTTDVPNPFGPGSIPAQAVPTDVVVGPDGAYYVSQLTGFPFAGGAAKIFRVVPGEAPTVYADGLTNVTSLAWRGDTLYAVQLSNLGLIADGPNGSLVKVTGGVSKVADLFAPYGLAIRSGSAYVSTCAVCAGGGSVVRIPLS